MRAFIKIKWKICSVKLRQDRPTGVQIHRRGRVLVPCGFTSRKNDMAQHLLVGRNFFCSGGIAWGRILTLRCVAV